MHRTDWDLTDMRNIFWFAVLVTESFKSIPTKWFLVTADRPKFDGVLLKFTTSHVSTRNIQQLTRLVS